MKDVSRRATNQAENFLTPKEDLPFHDDGSLPDSAFQSDFSNGSVPDLEKSPSSGDAVSYERNSLQESTDDLSLPFTDFCSTSCRIDWSEEQSTSYSDTRECDEACSTKGLVPQPNIERGPTIFEEGHKYWENVSSWCTVSPDFSCCNLSDEDEYSRQSKFSRQAQQNDGVIRELQGARHLNWNFTHEVLSPITEGQGLEEFESYDSDNGISDVESEESDALWSPSSEDAPLVRPDFVPKLDLSWVFEDENVKQKRSEKRAAAQRHAEKEAEINTPLCVKLPKTSTSPDTKKVAENHSRRDKAECTVSECCKEVSHKMHRTREHKALQEECTDTVPSQYNHKNYSVDQALAHGPRPQTLDRTIWLSETSKNEDLCQQQSRRSLTAKLWPENSNFEPYFDRTTSESRSNHSAQVTNSKAKCFSCLKDNNIEDYEQSEQRESYEELPESGLNVSDTNHQASSSNNRSKAGYKIDDDSYPQVLLLTKYYVIGERDPQLCETRQHCGVSENEQETETLAIQSHSMLETNSRDSSTHRMTSDRQKRDLHFVSSRTSNAELDADTNTKLKLVQFKERNAETTDSERQEEYEEEQGGQNVMRNEPNSEELYDLEAAVFRRGRRQKLAKFVCFSIGCQSACCQKARCQPCYCDWKCDVKCFR